MIQDRADSGAVLTIDVCNDHALRAWILGFGPDARLVSAVTLAQVIYDANGPDTPALFATARPFPLLNALDA